MENLPLELFSNIIRFLSINEKKRLRDVSRFFYYNISHNILTTIKLEYLFAKNNSIQQLSSLNANLIFITETLHHYIYKNINDYMPKGACPLKTPCRERGLNLKGQPPPHGAHRYYNLTNLMQKECVISSCREKRAEYLYLSKKKINNNISNIYNIKYIPYCTECFTLLL